MLKKLTFLLFMFAGVAMATEEPKYELLEKTDDFELRAYDVKIIAEVEVTGSLSSASNKGFRLIADYIFGNNRSAIGEAQKISMTTPVAMERVSENISMTKPVSMQGEDGMWRMNFVMPSEYSMATLPTPNNPAVTLREIPSSTFAVLRFSGLAGADKVAVKTESLRKWMTDKGLTPEGQPVLARYDPPWTLPFLRRNEIMIEY